ncbi:MAG TPA: hypothetical protein VEB42_14630 [Chitinophagaceae bacterium]|nr:hypothetical protein [Chitinophagaceae bacterium]
MSSWVKRGQWNIVKQATIYSPDQETAHLYEELRVINDKIEAREREDRHGTKEELEAKAKIIGMITALKKNIDDKWRNVTPGFEIPDFKKPQFEEFRVIFKNRDGTYEEACLVLKKVYT